MLCSHTEYFILNQWVKDVKDNSSGITHCPKRSLTITREVIETGLHFLYGFYGMCSTIHRSEGFRKLGNVLRGATLLYACHPKAIGKAPLFETIFRLWGTACVSHRITSLKITYYNPCFVISYFKFKMLVFNIYWHTKSTNNEKTVWTESNIYLYIKCIEKLPKI